MTFTQLLFLIIIAIIAYFLLNIGLTILIIAIVLIVIYYLVNLFISKRNNNSYNSVMHRQELFSPTNLPLTLPLSLPNDYYIPINEYYREQASLSSNYHVPGSISEYCVNKQLGQHGDLSVAINQCQLPTKISARYAVV